MQKMRHWSHTGTHRCRRGEGGRGYINKWKADNGETDGCDLLRKPLWDHIDVHRLSGKRSEAMVDELVGTNELLTDWLEDWRKRRGAERMNNLRISIWSSAFFFFVRPKTCQTWAAAVHQHRVILSASASWPMKSVFVFASCRAIAVRAHCVCSGTESARERAVCSYLRMKPAFYSISAQWGVLVRLAALPNFKHTYSTRVLTHTECKLHTLGHLHRIRCWQSTGLRPNLKGILTANWLHSMEHVGRVSPVDALRSCLIACDYSEEPKITK